jgi:hypothetical protein
MNGSRASYDSSFIVFGEDQRNFSHDISICLHVQPPEKAAQEARQKF